MAEPTLGELVKMQEEVGAAKRLRRCMTKSDSNPADNNGPRVRDYPVYRATYNDTPREEPATLRKWKQKYGSRYMTAMHLKPSDAAAPRAFKPRDPRFDTRCGEYIPEVFRANYSFVKEMRQNEVDKMKKEISKVSRVLCSEKVDDNQAAELASKQRTLKQLVKTSQNRMENEKRRVEQFRLINEVKRKEALESAREGRHPHFMNRAEINELKLAAQYRQLKESGEIDKYLDRKRRKAAQTVRRFRPE